jgi:tetraacyldisaccharide 4'-kinase
LSALLKLIRVILFPITILYDVITRVRNHLYDSGYKPSFKFEVLTISVGNLNVGGSGKTPMVEYLIRLLKGIRQLATLSRGYGRGTKGFRLASEQDSARTLGDEPFQIYRKFGSHVKVAVGEERALAIPNILHEHPEVDLILLDDAFQHRSVQPHFSILLTEYTSLFFNDLVIPTGNLREARKGASRADVAVVTKCPDVLENFEREQIALGIKKYLGEKPVFFSRISYGKPIGFGSDENISKSIILVSGIAHASSLASFLRMRHEIVRHFHFQDHHSYLEKEMKEIIDLSRLHQCSILTTEKDMVRLIDSRFDGMIKQASIFFIPIQMEFLENGPDFDKLITEKVKSLIE